MPAESEKQRRLACVARNIKLGKSPKWVSKAARQMAESMTLAQLTDYCEGKIKK